MAYSRNFDSEITGAAGDYAAGNIHASATMTIDDVVYYGGSGKSLAFSNNSANVGHQWAYDTANTLSSGDFTVVYKGRMNVTDSGSGRCRVGFMFRVNAGGTTGYVAMFRPQPTSSTVRLAKLSTGTETVISTANYSASVIFTANAWYWMKITVLGTSIKIRAWLDGDSEPSTWLIDTTDASYDNTNVKCGVYYFDGSTSPSTAYVDDLEEAGGSVAVVYDNMLLMGVS